MGLPSKLKDFILFNDGGSYLGQVTELTLPKLSRKMEEYRASGMTGPVMVDYGNEAITLDWTASVFLEDALAQYGAEKHHAVQLRFAGAFQNDDTGNMTAIDITVRGRHKEIDMGTIKHGTETAHKYSTMCSYYKLAVNSRVWIELDFMNGIEIINGVDRNAPVRQAIGM